MVMLLGKKIGMTQVYDDAGRMTAVTVIQAGPCTVMQVKKPETDGYTRYSLDLMIRSLAVYASPKKVMPKRPIR
jgi:large subunit ribosomal protein L3